MFCSMKNLFYCLIFVGLVVLGACTDKKPQQPVNISINIDYVDENDTTLYGKCGDGSSMHVLELVTDKGDTLYVSVNEDSLETLKGGMTVGDRMAVAFEKDAEMEGYGSASIAINLTTLMGKWMALDKTFELQEGGIVTGDTSEPKPYREWKIFNGHLVLSTDTFDVYALSADSLFLEGKQGIFAYKRVTVAEKK